ncbi:MAG TPA: L,D-transpeptidase [Pseudonocardiaceae bacterium]|nr:L,D-transpeptidase [Pseudonocardiaceae bacterium]
MRRITITVVGLGLALALALVVGGCARQTAQRSQPATTPERVALAVPAAAPTTTTPAPQPPPCDPDVVACVRLSSAQAWLRVPGQDAVGPVSIGYGVGAYATPTGLFRVSWKAEHWVSHEYHEPMPDAVFFAAGGIAFHAGSLDATSHGCVHLAPDVAAEFFATLQPGMAVQVLP